jgi:CBS domain-containing protein
MNVAAILKEKGRTVFTAAPDIPLQEIARELTQNGVGCIVLVDKEGAISGIVSERDIVKALARSGSRALEAPVSKSMTKDVIVCREADTIDELMAEMTIRRVRHIPVVESGKLVGIVSIGDVVKHRIAEAEMEAAAMRAYIATG